MTSSLGRATNVWSLTVGALKTVLERTTTDANADARVQTLLRAFERSTVEQNGVVGDSRGGRVLVHDARLDADKAVLRPRPHAYQILSISS